VQYWFGVCCCWYLWYWRNKSLFEASFSFPNNPLHCILAYSIKVVNSAAAAAATASNPAAVRHEQVIGWAIQKLG
jgi:hypothetical protein